MSEYWVSKKKYFCKYCDIYIADDAPSRNHHESGMRHKGNLERFIRGIYKTGEKRKKDLEEERREMARVEQLANAAFAADVAGGLAKASSGPSTSKSTRPPPPKPSSSNPYANYSTAQSLGYTDPDAERLAKEAELRRSQGVAGEWQVVETVTPPPKLPGHATAPNDEDGMNGGEDVKPDVHGEPGEGAAVGEKRPAEQDEDTRSFKLRKKTVGVGLGEIYDPGLIPIKVKPKKEDVKKEEEVVPAKEEPAPAPLKWAPVSLNASTPASKDQQETSVKKEDHSSTTPAPAESSGSKWAKVSWSKPVTPPPPPIESPPVKQELEAEALPEAAVKEESIPPETTLPVSAPKFKKRKVPTTSAGGRRAL